MKIYRNEQLREIIFPLGGIGSGCIGLSGSGHLVDWEIFNRPAKGSHNGYSQISVRTVAPDGTVNARSLTGDVQKDLMGQYSGASGYGFGYRRFSMAGFPHFESVEFVGKFPMAELHFASADFPGTVTLKAFNPFIPLDAKNSSIPAAFFEIEFTNTSTETLEFSTAFSLRNPFESSLNTDVSANGVHAVQAIHSGISREDKAYGDLTLACDAQNCHVQPYWYRGKWMDGIVTFWNEWSSGRDLTYRTYEVPDSRDHCAVQATVSVAPQQSASIHYVLTWNMPNCYNYWKPYTDENGNDVTWKNYYATLFDDSACSAMYAMQNWNDLYTRTAQFTDALHNTTLDPAVIDAASANLSVLKSPTVLRLEDGSFWGWEGCEEVKGSCEGTCQHVWNYAYALCYLFPELERSIRNYEFKYQTLESGYTMFRTSLPLTRERKPWMACVDGQMGTVIKTYREWKLSGDTEWLRSVWSTVKKVLEFAWHPENPYEWDRDKDGVLEGRQHHTLDMELFGPSSWLQGFYMAALKAAAKMALAMGEPDKAAEYTALFEKGYAWTKENLFNGKYFIQKINLNDRSIPAHFDCCDAYWNDETGEIKYQIGEGSSIDQLCAQWHCFICDLGYVFDEAQVKTALQSMWQNNFKESMRSFANPWRVFAMNDESGSVICDYPAGVRKPKIPVPYCEESMHGFEYQFAGLLVTAGMLDEAVHAVKAVRDRYNGANRNPWNEIECGSNYARSMASFALLPLFSGLKVDLVKHAVTFAPKLNTVPYRCVWSAGSGWGEMLRSESDVRIALYGGLLTLTQFTLPFADTVSAVTVDGNAVSFSWENGVLTLPNVCIHKELVVTVG